MANAFPQISLGLKIGKMPESDFRNVPKQKNFTGTADRNTQTENAGSHNPDFSLTDRTRWNTSILLCRIRVRRWLGNTQNASLQNARSHLCTYCYAADHWHPVIRESPAHQASKTPAELGPDCVPSRTSCQRKLLFRHSEKPPDLPVSSPGAYRASPQCLSGAVAALAAQSGFPADAPSTGPPSSSARRTEQPPAAPPTPAQSRLTASSPSKGRTAAGSPFPQPLPSQATPSPPAESGLRPSPHAPASEKQHSPPP